MFTDGFFCGLGWCLLLW